MKNLFFNLRYEFGFRKNLKQSYLLSHHHVLVRNISHGIRLTHSQKNISLTEQTLMEEINFFEYMHVEFLSLSLDHWNFL